MNHILVVGVATRAASRERTIEIAAGRRKRLPDEPRVWFTSLESLAKVLSTKNMLLLEMIRTSHPQSIQELADLSGRKKPNLTRTLKNMETLGIIEFQNLTGGRKQPKVNYDDIHINARLPLQVA
jgi:predicted transcriptional regulator